VWGVVLQWESKGIRCPLNASGFGGVRFHAKGPGTVRVGFGLPETQAEGPGGVCKSGCYDYHGKIVYLREGWADYVVPWNRLEQGGWGVQARFDPARIVNLTFSAKPNSLPLDVWIDDIAFVTPREAEALVAMDRAQPPPSAAR
jgi:hypothetical protein